MGCNIVKVICDSGISKGGPQGASAPSLLLEQTKAQRAEKNLGGRPGPPLSQGLDLSLCESTVTHSMTR